MVRKLSDLKGSTTPRVSTPPARELTEDTTLGYQVIEFARDVADIELLPWQEWLLIHALELAPGVTLSGLARGERDERSPIFRFRQVVVMVARQNGKTVLSQVMALYCLFALRFPLVLGTAQDLDLAESVLDGVQDIIDDVPELAAASDRPVRGAGKRKIRTKHGSQYIVKATTRGAGRGRSADLVLLDELREQTTWDAWGAITKTANARASALIWAMSNAGDASSVVLRYLRMKAHEALGDPDGIVAQADPEKLLPASGDTAADATPDDPLAGVENDTEDFVEDINRLGLFEWSAPPDSGIMDLDGWRQANPAMGYTGLSAFTIAGDAKNDPEWVFRTEILCQWSEGLLEGPFPAGSWEQGMWTTDTGEALPQIQGAAKACLDMSLDRARTFVAVAGYDGSGKMQIELAASRPGVDWVMEWLDTALREGQIDEITGQAKGSPVSDLIQELEYAGYPVATWSGSDLTAGTGRFYDAVVNQDFRHFDQPPVDVPASAAATKITDGGSMLFDRRRSMVDVAPLMAFTGAHWLLTRPQENEDSAYESHGLLVL